MLYLPNDPSVIAFTRDLDTQELLRRICVRPPYFALHDPRIETGPNGPVFVAHAQADQIASSEIGPMQGGDLSRHGAIAGLCAVAVAQSDDEQRFYLAREAWFEGFKNPAPYGTPVEFRAEVLEMDRRQARALIVATADGQPVNRLEVVYTILTQAAFKRLFRGYQQDTPVFERMGMLASGTVSVEGDTWVHRVERVNIEACAGHFEQHPAMPVAMLMDQLQRLAVRATPALQDRFRSVRGIVKANDFCWAGESASFSVRPVTQRGTQVVFDCTVKAGTREVASMEMTLEAVTE